MLTQVTEEFKLGEKISALRYKVDCGEMTEEDFEMELNILLEELENLHQDVHMEIARQEEEHSKRIVDRDNVHPSFMDDVESDDEDECACSRINLTTTGIEEKRG